MHTSRAGLSQRESPVLLLIKYFCKLGIATVAQIAQVQMQQLPFHFSNHPFGDFEPHQLQHEKLLSVFKQIYVWIYSFPIVDF